MLSPYVMLVFITLGTISYGKPSEHKGEHYLDPKMVDHVMDIINDIERYKNRIPNMFGKVRQSLEVLERQLKIATLIPAPTELESFRLVCKPFNEYLKQEPKDYLIHNPPRGSVQNAQLKDAKNKVRLLYNKLQKLWLNH